MMSTKMSINFKRLNTKECFQNKKNYIKKLGFLSSSDGKASACNAGDPGSIPGSGRSPREGNGNPLRYSCLENSKDRGAWRAIYSPWGRKESDTTERLIHTHTH